MMIQIVYTVILVIALYNLVLELKRTLMMMQQNSYRPERYMRWLRSSADSTSWPRLTGICVLLASLVFWADPSWAMGIIAAFAAGSILYLTAKSRSYKKPLVWTARARRIYCVMALVSTLVAALSLLAAGPDVAGRLFAAAVAVTALYCGSHIVTLLAVWILAPVERAINARYRRDAERILASMPHLKVIGITGSYGKTSTKHYLHRLLSECYSVTMTPGSFNTTLGVIRTIREHLKPYDEIFIAEMGAKQPDDVADICRLVHPQAAILTAVGEQHLESFGTIECVQHTKFELIDALPADGFAVVNDDFPYIANRPVSNVDCVRYALRPDPQATWTATDIRYSAEGTTFTMVGPDTRLELHTRLIGECNISNLLGAVIMAIHLGVPDDKLRRAVADIRQVEHRLSVKRTPGGVTVIDDAFNSNPTGSAMALDVLSGMTTGRRIVITPGMIELGSRQEELNREFGKHIARAADVAIIVGQYNRHAITEGIALGGMPDSAVRLADSFAHAQEMLAEMLKPGDVVLYENDLPDTFR